jgi:hypothetical protein
MSVSRVWWIYAACASVLLTAASSSSGAARHSGAFVAPPGPSGWRGSVAPNGIITDGSAILQIAGGPIRIISVELKQSGAPADIVGIDVRAFDPATMTQYLMTPGFPAQTLADWDGAEAAEGAVLDGAKAVSYELLIGYRLPIPGVVHRDSVIITYESGPARRTFTISSQADICVRADYDPAHPQSCHPDGS